MGESRKPFPTPVQVNMSQPTSISQFSRTPLLSLGMGALVILVLAAFPLAIRQEGMLAVQGLLGGAAALACLVVHPLVPFTFYFGALFFAEATLPGVPVSANQLFGILFLCSFASFAARGRAMLVRNPAIMLLTIIAIYFAINAITGEHAERGMLHFRYVVIYYVLALTVASSLSSERSIRALAWIIVGTTVAAATHGLYQTIEKDILGAFAGRWSAGNRVQGAAKNSVVFGWNLVYAFPVAFFLFSQGKTVLSRVLALLLGMFILFVATFTFNRQTYVVMAVVVGACALLFTYRNRAFLMTLLTGLGIAAALTVLPLMIIRLMTVTTLGRDPSFLEHRDSFLVAREMFYQHPWFGVGLGSFPGIWRNYLPADYTTYYYQYLEGATLRFPDFGYMQLLSETGLVGLGLVLSLYTWLAIRSWQYRKAAVAAADTFASNYASLILVLLGFAMLTTLIQDTFLYPRVWLIFGLALLIDPRNLPVEPPPAPVDEPRAESV